MAEEQTTTSALAPGKGEHGLVGVFLRGMLMGAADIVPGVSGGTMAFITGIYGRLIGAISAVQVSTLRQVLRGEWAAAWRSVDGTFLLTLLAGIALSVFTLARLITGLLISHPLLIWSFFFGLIVASAVVLVRHVAHWSPSAMAGICAGALFAALIGLSPSLTLPVSSVAFFAAGFVAICAMILPGVSGSFILVLLGMYEPVLTAVKGLQWIPLFLLAAGAGSGLLLFTRFLNMLLERFHGPTLATLTGFLLGSLPVVWPWRASTSDSELARPVLPSTYEQLTAGDPAIMTCLLCMIIGLLAVWLLEFRWGGLER